MLMDKVERQIGQSPMQRAMLFLCFAAVGTAGMATIALALLTESWATYQGDRVLMATQERRIEILKDLHAQQQELLANSQNPSVVERVAISNLKYQPAHAATCEQLDLPPAWPTLQEALAQIEIEAPAPEPTRWQRLAQSLADQPRQRTLLMLFGSVLVVISLTFFYQQR